MENQVHVIAVIDFAAVAGDIKYVLPVSSGAPSSAGAPDGRVTLRFTDAVGAPLAQVMPPVSLMSCDVAQSGAIGVGGMVQQTLPVPDAASRLELLIGDTVVDTFDTAPAPATSSGFSDFSLDAGPEPPGEPDPRRVSYTVQARPVGVAQWQTLAAGQAEPEYRLDPNQFAGAEAVDVRVIRNSGFSAEEISQVRSVLAQ